MTISQAYVSRVKMGVICRSALGRIIAALVQISPYDVIKVYRGVEWSTSRNGYGGALVLVLSIQVSIKTCK